MPLPRRSGELNRRESFMVGIPSLAVGLGALALVHSAVQNPDFALYVPGGVLTTVGTLSILHGFAVGE